MHPAKTCVSALKKGVAVANPLFCVKNNVVFLSFLGLLYPFIIIASYIASWEAKKRRFCVNNKGWKVSGLKKICKKNEKNRIFPLTFLGFSPIIIIDKKLIETKTLKGKKWKQNKL